MEKFSDQAIVEQAKAFAKTLALSQEFQKFYATQEQFNQDQEARALLENFQEKQRELQEAQMKGRAITGDAVTEVQQLYKNVQHNLTIMIWAKAQQDAIRLIQETNQAISVTAGFDFGQTLSGNGSC
jgi:cell fate (sporulation/competence/biofilm development) regulator YlbF (YheA/YmcA/DUF963 family)